MTYRTRRLRTTLAATRLQTLASLLAVVLLLSAPAPSAIADADDAEHPSEATQAALIAAQRAIRTLPEPFATWNVSLALRKDDPATLELQYDSPALGIRAVNSVFVPDRYDPADSQSPVMYYLHGTVVSSLDNPLLKPVTDLEALLNAVGNGGGDVQTQLQDFTSQADKADFLVVAPDTDPTQSWCQTCVWIDGHKGGSLELYPVTARNIPAETVLYEELIPLIEAIFNARTDREGRGIFGFSMGGIGALIQGFRHPDRFSYVGSISGPWDIVGDPYWEPWANAAGYFRDQGYGTSITNRVAWRNFNPDDLVTNFKGSGGELMLSAGDICAPPTDEAGKADCRRFPALRNPLAALIESQMRRSNDLAVKALKEAGVPARQFRASGVHGANNHWVFAEEIVPRANAVFATAPLTSSVFSYRTADRDFDIWGYQVKRDIRHLSPLELLEARRDGQGLIVVGLRHRTVITTPPGTSEPGKAVTVTLAAGDRLLDERPTVADREGRIRVVLDPSDARLASITAITALRIKVSK